VLEICRVNVLVNWVQEVSLVIGREFTLGENIWHFPPKYMKVEVRFDIFIIITSSIFYNIKKQVGFCYLEDNSTNLLILLNSQIPSGIVVAANQKEIWHFVQFRLLTRDLEILDPESALANF